MIPLWNILPSVSGFFFSAANEAVLQEQVAHWYILSISPFPDYSHNHRKGLVCLYSLASLESSSFSLMHANNKLLTKFLSQKSAIELKKNSSEVILTFLC